LGKKLLNVVIVMQKATSNMKAISRCDRFGDIFHIVSINAADAIRNIS